MIILTTTSIGLDPELENRCLLLTVDESREPTRAIHELQRLRMTFEGYERKAEKARLEKLHRNAQRLMHQCQRPIYRRSVNGREEEFVDDGDSYRVTGVASPLILPADREREVDEPEWCSLDLPLDARSRRRGPVVVHDMVKDGTRP